MEVRTPEQLLEKLLIQRENLPRYKTETGATDGDFAEIDRDISILQITTNRANVVEAGKKATNAIKDHVFNGDASIPVANYPTLPNDVPTETLVGGCLQRFNKRNKRFKAAAGYTRDIGLALGIEETKSAIAPDSVIPGLEADPARSGYLVGVLIGNRGDLTMWKLFGRWKGSEEAEEITSGTGKSADVVIKPKNPGEPEKIELFIQLYKNNKLYGQRSDSVYVTVSP